MFLKNSRLLNKISISAFVLAAILLVRAASLEYGDLIDPTETRYATIAQNILLQNDWVVPRLPTEDGLVPYVGKPPLHFWLTALSYKIFGFDEWTARFPSLLAMLLIVGSIITFAKNFFNKQVGLIASIICISAPLMYILGGSSTIDITFTAFIFASQVAFAVCFKRKQDGENHYISGVSFFLFSALAFMTKGPAALILIGIPIFLITIFDRNLAALKSLPWFAGLALFLLITAPWFYLVEKENPGTLWYLFVQENFLRYVTKDYGDRYGTAHVYPYGTIWIMLLAYSFPWSLFLLRDLYFKLKRFREFRFLQSNRATVFAISCGLSPLLFFTLARSIHAAYVLPAFPGLAIYLASLWSNGKETGNTNDKLIKKLSTPFYFPSAERIGGSLATIMIVVLLIGAPRIEANKSASEIMEVIADTTKSSKPVVAIVSANNYSPYWTSSAYEQELSKPIEIVYADSEDVDSAKYRHLLIRGGKAPESLETKRLSYKRVATRGKWHWYRRDNEAEKAP